MKINRFLLLLLGFLATACSLSKREESLFADIRVGAQSENRSESTLSLEEEIIQSERKREVAKWCDVYELESKTRAYGSKEFPESNWSQELRILYGHIFDDRFVLGILFPYQQSYKEKYVATFLKKDCDIDGIYLTQ